MNKIYSIPAAILTIFLFSACARTVVNTSQTPAIQNLSAKEKAEEIANKKALDYCAKYGHRGYEKVSSSSTAALASSNGVKCGTVSVSCPSSSKKTCLEYQCYKETTEWTTKLAFRCK